MDINDVIRGLATWPKSRREPLDWEWAHDAAKLIEALQADLKRAEDTLKQHGIAHGG